MSDKPENTQEAADKTDEPTQASADATSPSWDPAKEPPRPPAGGAGAQIPARRFSPVAWMALLLVIALGAAAYWSVGEAQRREAVLKARLVSLESVESTQKSELAAFGQLQQEQVEVVAQEVQVVAQELQAAASAQATQLEQLDAALVLQREELARFGATDRKDWLLAEAQYLLRLANQRLIMAGDVVAASALLRSADSILLELDDVTLHTARGAVAQDLTALRAVPKVDVEGIYLRLAALSQQVSQLAIFRLPDMQGQPEAIVVDDWQARFQQGYDEALHKLSEYIVIRRRDVPYEALMDPQWERLVRQNMRMLLEQGQVALLSGNQSLYEQSLERAGHWVSQFFEVDEAGSKALAQDIDALAGQTIAVEIPDLSRSLRALDDAMERRLQLEDSQ